MPATSSTPSTMVPAVNADFWEVVGVNIRPGTPPQTDILYNFRSGPGPVQQGHVLVDATPYMKANPAVYGLIKQIAYQVLIDSGIMPGTAKIS